MSRYSAITLYFSDGPGAVALRLDDDEATAVSFNRGCSLVLGRQTVPAGLIRYAQTPTRSMRLGFIFDEDAPLLVLFDEFRQFGYAICLTDPARSRWIEVDEGIDTAELRGRIESPFPSSSGGIDADLAR